MTVMSRVNGWLTVTPKNANRKRPLEKESPKNNPIGAYATDQLDISKLSPTWMQRNQERGRQMVKKHGFEVADNMRTVPATILRGENARVFMVDKTQPSRSVFNIGDARHNLDVSSITRPVALGKTKGLEHFQKRLEWGEQTFQGKEGGRGFASLRRQFLKNREVTKKV